MKLYQEKCILDDEKSNDPECYQGVLSNIGLSKEDN